MWMMVFDSVGGDQQEPSIIVGDDDSEVNKTSHDMEDAVDGETDFFPDSYRE